MIAHESYDLGTASDKPTSVSYTVTIHDADELSQDETLSRRLRYDLGTRIDGRPVLSYAIAERLPESVVFPLIRRTDRAHVDDAGNTPLMYALSHNLSDVSVRELSDRDNVDHRNRRGVTSLMVAVRHRNPLRTIRGLLMRSDL